MKLDQYSEYLVSIQDTDGLVLQHQGISSYSAEYAPMPLQNGEYLVITVDTDGLVLEHQVISSYSTG